MQEQTIEALKEDSSTGIVTKGSQPEKSEGHTGGGPDSLQAPLQSSAAVRLAEDDPGMVEPGDALHGSPEAEEVPQPGAAQAIEDCEGAADTEAVSADGHSDKLSEGLNAVELGSETSTAQTLQGADTGMQHGGPGDSRDADSKALLDAVRQGSIGDVEWLLKAGCNADAQDADGCTALHFAAESKYLVSNHT